MIAAFALQPHPAFPAPPGVQLGVQVARRSPQQVALEYRAEGNIEDVVIPPPAAMPTRADGLWQATCFELFLQPEGDEAYVECNFAPSEDWAVYGFDGYRAGMRPLDVPAAPDVRVERREHALVVKVELALPLTSGVWRIAPAAILADRDGARSFWAVKHGAGEPDFHRADCFVGRLPPPPAP